MFKGDWFDGKFAIGLVVGLFLAVLLGIFAVGFDGRNLVQPISRQQVVSEANGQEGEQPNVWSPSAPEDQPGQEESPPDSQDRGEGQQTASLTLSSALQGIERAIRDLVPEEDHDDRRQQQERERRDLSAQEGMAWWAELMFYAASATVILTFFALVAILRTLHHTRRAADYTEGMLGEAKATTVAARDTVTETRRIGEAQVKAYLSIKAAKAFIDENDGIVFDVTVRNFGQSPAKDVHAIASVWVNREITLPAAMGGETRQTSVEVFSHHVCLGDIPAGESVASGIYSTHGLSFPADAMRNAEGIIFAGPGSIGVFAKDVFGREIFECDGILVATGTKQFGDWERHGNFAARSIFGRFGDASAMRQRGWKEYEGQDHRLPFEK